MLHVSQTYTIKTVETLRATSLHGILPQKPFQMGRFSGLKILNKLWFKLFCYTSDTKAVGTSVVVACAHERTGEVQIVRISIISHTGPVVARSVHV